MNQEQITELVAKLTGQLQTTSPEEETKLHQLQDNIAAALVHQDPTGISKQEFLFQRSDLIAPHNPFGDRIARIKKMVNVVVERKQTKMSEVFVRHVPIRSTQIANSINLESAGTRVKTLGPFYDIQGTPSWFDFVVVKKLISLYVQGQTMPALLFDATFLRPRYFPIDSKPVELTRKFTIDPESVWVQAKLFNAAIPDNQYCGIRVKGGSISLDMDPFMSGDHLTIAANCNVVCALNLEQNTAFSSDPSSPYGKDARNAKFHMPDTFNFSFKNNVKNIQAIGSSKMRVYGHDNGFKYGGNQACVYNPFISRLAIPMEWQQPTFEIQECLSPFFQVSGSSKIVNSWWALSLTKLNVASPLEADGTGAIIMECKEGLDAKWTNLQNKNIALKNPFILAEPGRICITDLFSDGAGAFQQFAGWKDEQNPFGTTLHCKYNKDALFIFNTDAKGDEVIVGVNDWDIKADRPVKVNGEAVAVKTKNSGYLIAMSATKNMLMVVDENMLWDNMLPIEKIPHVKPFALAMRNALLTVTPPNSLVLFASSTTDLKTLTNGKMYLGYGLYSYLPTLPDPYAANLGLFKSQFRSIGELLIRGGSKRDSRVWLWLISLVEWEPFNAELSKVDVSFHFAPLVGQLDIVKDSTVNATIAKVTEDAATHQTTDIFSQLKTDVPLETPATEQAVKMDLPDYNVYPFANLNLHDFALLDVSSKANQMGVSYAKQNNRVQVDLARKYKINIEDETNATIFPIQIRGLDAITAGINAQAFTVPTVAWEPVFNLTPPMAQPKPGDTDADGVPYSDPGSIPHDPPLGFNYYPNDGFPTRIGNLSKNQVPLSPIPMAKFLVETYKNKEDGRTFAFFNLPFGMVALTILDNKSTQITKPDIQRTKPLFDNHIKGGMQLELTAGTSFNGTDENNMFEGYTFQMININSVSGHPTGSSTLAGTPTQIFNNEFYYDSSDLSGRPGVPLSDIGISGYGASMFSNWHNKAALFAQTSQAQFNVVTGRTSHEVVQVKSMLYPWGIRVVRTITLFRLANGYVARIDSGWKAESDGLFDFSYKRTVKDGTGNAVLDADGNPTKEFVPRPFEFHPGVVRGLYNVRNIREIPKAHFLYFDNAIKNELAAVTFDADVELENITEGGQGQRVPSKGVLAYVQIKPAGQPISIAAFKELLLSENNSIGGSVSCVMKVANTKQRMKINRFDVSPSTNVASETIFVCAARGSVVMPKDGSWTMVQHNRGTGEVSPLPEHMSVPLVRFGEWVKDIVVSDFDVANSLLRVAHPEDLLKIPDANTINFGFLQNMGTQKVLFMTPGFKLGIDTLLSKAPPLLADSFRLLNSKGIFPNIGNIENDFGQAISLLKGIDKDGIALDAFVPDADGIFKLPKLDEQIGADKKLLDQGYQLLKGAVGDLANEALKFDLPEFDYKLIDLPGKLVISVQYKASSKADKKNYAGKFDYNVDSFAGDLVDTWKGRMNNLALVVTIGPLTDVMTIKGNFNSQKGKDVDLGSGSIGDSLELPTPEIEFSGALDPVIKILEILSSLSSGDYGAALKKGLKIAMSNSANIWEYKFEANKDIPLVRFPPDALYDAPQTPLKLEASLGIGIFFNAAMKITSDPAQLLPTAGGYFKFHGGLQVMCVSIGAGTIYAVGNVDLKLEADTSPKVAVTMKFGFGAQVTVGLPVVGHVSILFMVGIEIYADSTSKVKVTASMLFRGEAELLGGIVSVTITIEASGSVEKEAPTALKPNPPANCEAQVTFGLDISIFLIIDISFSESWKESRQIA